MEGMEDEVLCGVVLPGVFWRAKVDGLGAEVDGIRSGVGCCSGSTSV